MGWRERERGDDGAMIFDTNKHSETQHVRELRKNINEVDDKSEQVRNEWNGSLQNNKLTTRYENQNHIFSLSLSSLVIAAASLCVIPRITLERIWPSFLSSG